MAHTKSAKKRLRQDEQRRRRNQARKSRIRSTSKSVMKAVEAGDGPAASTALKKAVSAIDRAAQRNILQKNTAGRKKSRLSRAVAKMNNTGPAGAQA